jgi:hypothetical protein
VHFEAGAGDPGQVIVAQVQLALARVLGGAHQKGKVYLVRGQACAQGMRCIDLDIHRQRGVLVMQDVDEVMQPGVYQRFREPQAQRAAYGIAGLGNAQHFFPQFEHALRMRQQLLAFFRQLDAACAAFKQAHIHIAFQRRDALRNRWLGGVQLFRRGTKASKLGDPHKSSDLFEVHCCCAAGGRLASAAISGNYRIVPRPPANHQVARRSLDTPWQPCFTPGAGTCGRPASGARRMPCRRCAADVPHQACDGCPACFACLRGLSE